uniref:YCF37-like protein n=1 Tax=Zea mays TaxID=4577 RepID=A0A804PPH3_MAIZE
MAVSIAGSSIRLHVAPPSRRRVSVVSAAAAARLDRRSAALLLLSTAVPAASAATAPPASAAGIGLFGIRKKLERAEEAAVEAVREKEVASEGLQLVAGAELAGDGLVQAAVVAGAEALGVVVGLSVVNGILKPEA